MMKFYKAIATGCGIGYIGKGAGSVAAALYCIGYFWFKSAFNQGAAAVLITIFIISVGIWSANKLELIWGKDNRKIVIDEIAGMQVALLFIPPTPLNILIAFALFRFFDIVKPLYIKKMEKLPKGWGVMSDDILAGVYSNLLLQVFIRPLV